MKQRGWFYRNFICGHWISGQIKATTDHNGRKRHYRECQWCGKRFYV